MRTGITSSVKGLGGALYIDSTGAESKIVVSYSRFTDVSAAVLGGAMYIDSGKYLASITLDHNDFTSVFSVTGSLLYASFIDQQYGKLYVKNCKVTSVRHVIDVFLQTI